MSSVHAVAFSPVKIVSLSPGFMGAGTCEVGVWKDVGEAK
jgi:hypothetical protein